MIDDVFKITQTLLNKERQGNITPESFNQIAKITQENIFSEYFEVINRNTNRENKGLTNTGYGNLVFNERQKISQFRVLDGALTHSVLTGNYALPSDLYFIEDNGILFNSRPVPEVKPSMVNYLNNSLAAPDTSFPIYTPVEDGIRVFPSTITSNLNISYLRTPKDPKWTFNIVGGIELFNPASASFQDFELHVSEFPNICMRVLSHFGITIRESDIVQIAEILQQKMLTKDNS